jgi:hypothetical protein
MAPRSPFEVLGVAPWASTAEVQRAYRAIARRLHPDHLPPSTPPAEAARAAERLREASEAWAVLRDPRRRASALTEWHAQHPGASTQQLGERPWDGPFGAPAPSRRPPSAEVRARPSDAPPSTVRWPVVLAVGALAVVGLIFLATAYIGGSTDEPPAVPTSPYSGHPCVSVAPGPTASVVSCRAPNDGRVVAHVRTAADCPAGSVARRLDASDAGISCLVPAGPTAVAGS